MVQNILRVLAKILIFCFAIYGFFLFSSWMAIKMGWTKTAGATDVNNRYFTEITQRQIPQDDQSTVVKKSQNIILNRITLLHHFYPQNAKMIIEAYLETKDEGVALRMLDAADLRLKEDKKYQQAVKKLLKRLRKASKKKKSLFEWMNNYEWSVFKEAVAKDSAIVDSVARRTGVEARLIVSCLVAEQMRLFNSNRERFKSYLEPLKKLGMGATFSYGVAGIKDFTAAKIERNLKDKKSPFYLGEPYEKLLDYDSLTETIEQNKFNDTLSLRLKRLVQFNNHYYSYLYTALFIKQIRTQWQKSGFDIDNRPEIFASLFNLGFQKSIPKSNPKVGGAIYEIGGKSYTFGAIAYEFFYSGELQTIFPFQEKSFDF